VVAMGVSFGIGVAGNQDSSIQLDWTQLNFLP